MDREFLTLEEYVNEAVSHGKTNSYKTETKPSAMTVEAMKEWLEGLGVDMSSNLKSGKDIYLQHKDQVGHTMVIVKFPKNSRRKEAAKFIIYYDRSRKLTSGYEYTGDDELRWIITFSETNTGTDEYFNEIYQCATGEIR